MLQRLFPAIIFLLSHFVSAQDVAIGEWRDHLSYRQSVALAEAGDKIYCATTAGLFSYSKADNSIERMSTINGLSDIGINSIAFSKDYNTLLVAYSSTNLDLLTPKGIVNIPDIKNKSILGQKTINNVYFHENYAYLACGFGIVVLDIIKKEIKDTYLIGPGGTQINVHEVTVIDNLLFAATEKGVYSAPISNPNLADYKSWSRETSLPQEKFVSIVTVENKMFTVLEHPDNFQVDTIYVYQNKKWGNYRQKSVVRTKRLQSSNGHLIRDGHFLVVVETSQQQELFRIGSNQYFTDPVNAIYDKDGILWIADGVNGLIRYDNQAKEFEQIIPNSPVSSKAYDMAAIGGNLYVVPGDRTGNLSNTGNREGVFSFVDGTWSVLNKDDDPRMGNVNDLVRVIIDPTNSSRLYAGSWQNGLLEIENGQLKNQYLKENSGLEDNDANCFEQNGVEKCWTGIGGLAFDQENNLWMTNASVETPLVVKMANGSWRGFRAKNILNDPVVDQLVIDEFGQKWALVFRKGILVFDDNGTLDNENDDRAKLLTNSEGNGGLPNTDIRCLAMDKDGEIWVGTSEGVVVFFSPERVFTGSGFDAESIIVEFDGHHQRLFEFEVVTTIAVDGANRKWVGTESAGVFLISDDGTEQLLHLTADNSPLFSDEIKNIKIDSETGEVYIATARGLISYKGTATEGDVTFGDVYAYPNPVRPEHEGVIAIRGLVANADVKITDITGTLIYETKANGGQAIWNGMNFNGERAQTGVYLVFATNDDGSEAMVTKILFIN